MHLYAFLHNNNHHHHTKNTTIISGFATKEGTIPKETTLTTSAVGGRHILKCTNMVQNKEECIIEISTTILTVL
jgi:hypothetical protein